MSEQPSRPRDFLNSPSLFGEASIDIKAELLDPESGHTDAAHAAEVQSVISQTISILLRQRKLTQTKLAADTGINVRKLQRLMGGYSWLSLTDAAALSRALQVDLAYVLEHGGRTERRHLVRLSDARRATLEEAFAHDKQP